MEQRHLLGTSPFCYDPDEDDEDDVDDDDGDGDGDGGDGGEGASEDIVSQGNHTLDKAPFSFSSLSSPD